MLLVFRLPDPLKKQEGKPTGFASPISNSGHIFTPEE